MNLNRHLLLNIAKYGVSLGLVFLILRKVPIFSVLEQARRIHIGWLFFAIFCNFLILWIQAARWKVLMPKSQASVTRLFAWCIIGAAAGFVMPSAVGGDTLRAVLLGREESDMGASVASTIMGRLFGLLAMGCFCLIGIFFWPPLRSLLSLPKVIVLATLILGCALFLFFLSKGKIGLEWAGSKWSDKIKALLAHAADTISSPRQLALIAFLSFLLQAVTILTSWILFRACGQNLSLAAAGAIFPIIMLGSMAPISIGGVGIREGLTVALFRQFAGVPAAISLTVNLIGYVALFTIGATGALCWAFLRPRNKPMPKDK